MIVNFPLPPSLVGSMEVQIEEAVISVLSFCELVILPQLTLKALSLLMPENKFQNSKSKNNFCIWFSHYFRFLKRVLLALHSVWSRE